MVESRSGPDLARRVRLRSEVPMPRDTRWVLALVRVVLAISMTDYGWPKIRDLKSNADDFVTMGFRPGMVLGDARS
jgi:hypothetical protein